MVVLQDVIKYMEYKEITPDVKAKTDALRVAYQQIATKLFENSNDTHEFSQAIIKLEDSLDLAVRAIYKG